MEYENYSLIKDLSFRGAGLFRNSAARFAMLCSFDYKVPIWTDILYQIV